MSPTAIASLMREGDGREEVLSAHSEIARQPVGEPINPEAWDVLPVVGDARLPDVDTGGDGKRAAWLITPPCRLK